MDVRVSPQKNRSQWWRLWKLNRIAYLTPNVVPTLHPVLHVLDKFLQFRVRWPPGPQTKVVTASESGVAALSAPSESTTGLAVITTDGLGSIPLSLHELLMVSERAHRQNAPMLWKKLYLVRATE